MRSLADSVALRAGYALSRLAPEWSRNAVRNPCFVIGCGRSGSSFLRRLLATHPDLAVYPSEANRYWHPDLYPWESRTVEAPRIWIDPVEFSRVSLAGWSPERAASIRGLFGAFQAARRRGTFVNKSAMVHFMLPAVEQTFPGSRYIHLVRDGRAVALSYAKRMGGVAGAADPRFEETIDATSRYWQASMTEVDAQIRALDLGGRSLEVRYEDLCARPEEALETLASFLAVSVAPLLRSEAGNFHPMNHKFVEELTGSTLDRITDLMASSLASKGYARHG